ncbi:hypothetical protein [Pontibacter harenae]|uniref:hypothetical protein n=1 Tax=Pontibacter harenae TaxID=2894083 RepID=UPI001E3CED6E|nr:hypothetical protein [Pontibacter harenae]MCC9169101.1 hypothetical protein [Pontibacter harenae]
MELVGASPDRALRLAARQMLLNYIDRRNQLDNSAQSQWQQELWQKDCPCGDGIVSFWKVAVSNGAECASGQAGIPGGPLLEIDGKANTRFLGDMVAWFAISFAGVALY